MKNDNLNNKSINPWHNPISNITWGFMFTLITFNFLNLQYILTTVGAILLYIGFYNLRKENEALNIAWIFSIINIIIHMLKLIFISTPLNIKFQRSIIMTIILIVFNISFLIILQNGLKNIFKNANVIQRKNPIVYMIILEIIILICDITGISSSFFVVIPILFFCFYNLHSLYKLEDDLSNIEKLNKDENINRNKYILVYLLFCFLIVIICNLSFNHIKLESKKVDLKNAEEIRYKLINMKFPDYIIKDMSDEEVNLLKNAVKIDVSDEILMFDSKEKSVKNRWGVYNNITKPGRMNLKSTHIYIELKNNTMYALEYFQWLDGKAYWYDGFTIICSEKTEIVSGKLLYEKNEENYFATIPRLKNETNIEEDWFGGKRETEKITGAVNYPFGSKSQRGYVIYELNLKDDNCDGISIFNYIHYKTPFRIPYKETEHSNLMFNNNSKQHSHNFPSWDYCETN
ncbi:hypothetical protein [Clostridium ihumii]|uniref:hypothetical protein n=1 Tax=Clostridium ihumii TaxID=1470356 RepID=UPI003D3396C2